MNCLHYNVQLFKYFKYETTNFVFLKVNLSDHINSYCRALQGVIRY